MRCGNCYYNTDLSDFYGSNSMSNCGTSTFPLLLDFIIDLLERLQCHRHITFVFELYRSKARSEFPRSSNKGNRSTVVRMEHLLQYIFGMNNFCGDDESLLLSARNRRY